MVVTMHVDLTFTPYELERKDLSGRSVVVIDALRATSTMVAAFENGCLAFVPAGTVEEARELRGRNPGFLLAGERHARPLEGFDLGNSPRDYRPERVRGKTIVMTTTNGTQALLAARRGAEVFIASFLNLGAVAARLRAAGRETVLACSGEKDCFCLEDTVCAGALIERLEREGPLLKSDAVRAARILFEESEADIYGMLCACEWGQYLERIGLGKDLRICARIDSSRLVPVYRGGKIFIDQ